MTAAPRVERRKDNDQLALNPHAERITAEELRHLVKNFYGTRTLIFDRAMAESVLAYNTGNRRVSRRKLEALVQQMSDGQFENTGEPIIIAAEGVLNNGQHRLLAVVEADAVVDLDVRFGIARRVFTKTDTGAPRTGGDVLTIAGAAHGGALTTGPKGSEARHCWRPHTWHPAHLERRSWMRGCMFWQPDWTRPKATQVGNFGSA